MQDGAMDNERATPIHSEEKAFQGKVTPKASILQQVVLVCTVPGVLGLLCFAANSLVSSFVSESMSGSSQEVASVTDPSVRDPSWHLPPQGSPLPLVLMALAFSTLACLASLLQATDCVQRGDWSWIASAENCVPSTAPPLSQPVKTWVFWVAGTSLTLLAALGAASIALSRSTSPQARVIELPDGVYTSLVDPQVSNATEGAHARPEAAHVRNATELPDGVYKSPADARVSNATKMAPATSAVAHVRNATDSHRSRSFEGRVPGSKLKTAKEVAAARSSLACLVQRGRWVFNPQPRRLPWNWAKFDICDVRWCKADAHRLAGPQADQVTQASQWNIRTGLKYEWQPNKECGQYRPFQPEAFCAVMERLGGPLLLAGDSLTRLMQDSLHNMLQLNESQKREYMHTPDVCKQWEKSKQVESSRQLCKEVAYCGKQLQVMGVRNDRLSLVAGSPVVESPNPDWIEFYLPWLTLIKTWDSKAVLLNRGLHYTETAQFAEELEQAFIVLRERFPNLLILYRSSVAGHAGCETFEVPSENPQDRASLPFHWGEMHEQNGIAKRIVEKYGGVFLDIEPMTELRGDGHKGDRGKVHDCLHYCLPGPVDEWNRLLVNALSILL